MRYLEDLEQLIVKNRSYRRFYESARISDEMLRSWVNLARQSASARNIQTLRYMLLTEESDCDKIFPLLSWAGYIEDWNGAEKGERPSAYIIVLNDNSLSEQYFSDDGIASQSILLGASISGYGGCIVAAVKHNPLREWLKIPQKYKIIQVIALGKPKEQVVLESLPPNGDYKYWRDDKGIHHVPKRSLDDIILT